MGVSGLVMLQLSTVGFIGRLGLGGGPGAAGGGGAASIAALSGSDDFWLITVHAASTPKPRAASSGLRRETFDMDYAPCSSWVVACLAVTMPGRTKPATRCSSS